MNGGYQVFGAALLGSLATGCITMASTADVDPEVMGSTGGVDDHAETEGCSEDTSAVASSDGVGPGDDGSTDDGGTTGEPLPPYEAEIDWVPCPLFTGGPGLEAECAEILLPVDWSDPQGLRLVSFVKRIGNAQGGKQLWMLMGGPGGAGAGYESTAQTLTGADPDLVVYLPDHRGTGRSSRMGCPVEEAFGSPGGANITPAEWPSCLAAIDAVWGTAIDHLTTSAAARDLGWLIEQLRGTQAVHVFGSSYGTYWGHRYLQIHPDQPDSISLLGIAPPDFNFTQYTEQYDDAGRRFMDRCSDDPVCAARLGPDAEGFMEAVLAQVDAGLCPGALAAGLDRDTLKLYFSTLLSWSGAERALIPATLFRLARCNAADVVALQTAAPQMMDPLAPLLNDPLFSRALGNHISISEMWHPPIPTVAQAQQEAADAIFGLGSTEGRIELSATWPTYAHDEFVLNYAQSDVPMLMMVGEFDPNSPIQLGEEFATHFGGQHQYFFEIPDGNHGWHSPTAQGFGCAINVFFNFIQDPTGPLLDCMGDVLPMDFAGPPGLAQGFFGTVDLYDN